MVKIIASSKSLESLAGGINEELASLFDLDPLKKIEVVQCKSKKVWNRDHARCSLGVCYSDTGKIYLSPDLLSFESSNLTGVLVHEMAHRYHDNYNYAQSRVFTQVSDIIDEVLERRGFREFRANPEKYEKIYTNYVSCLFASEAVANLATFIQGHDSDNFLEAKALDGRISQDYRKRYLNIKDICLAVLNGTPFGLGDLRKMSYSSFVEINNLFDNTAADFGALTAWKVIDSFRGNKIRQVQILRKMFHSDSMSVVYEFTPRK